MIAAWSLVVVLASQSERGTAPLSMCDEASFARIESVVREAHPRARAVRADGDMRGSAAGRIPRWGDVRAMLEVRGAPATDPLNLSSTEMGGIEGGLMTGIPVWPADSARRSARERERAALYATAEDVALDLTQEALELLVMDAELVERREIKLETARMFDALAELSHARVSAGRGSNADATLLVARAATIRSEVRAVDAERQAVAARFREIVDDGALFCRVELEGALASPGPLAARPPEDTIARRPMLRAIDHQSEAAALEERAALWDFAPMPEVGVSYMWRPDPLSGAGGTMSHVDLLGARLVVPLPVGFESRLAMRAESRDRARMLKEERAALVRSLRARHDALASVERGARDEVAALEVEVRPLLEAASAATRAAYEVGEADLAMVIDVETELVMLDERILMARARATDARLLRDTLGGVTTP